MFFSNYISLSLFSSLLQAFNGVQYSPCTGYVLGLLFFNHIDAGKLLLIDGNYLGLLIVLCVTIAPLYTLNKVFEWSVHNWTTHPIAQNLSVYSNNNTSWMAVASDINTEYRRFIQKSNLYLGI